MNGNSRRQLIDAVNDNNGFALTLLGLYLINSQEDIEAGINMLVHAADAKNVLWAKNLKLYLRTFEDKSKLPIDYHALVDSDTREQLEYYITENDYWAMTILGDMLYQGRVMPQDRDAAEELLGRAANMGCLYASELINEYGLSTAKAMASDILKKFKNTNNPKYWIRK